MAALTVLVLGGCLDPTQVTVELRTDVPCASVVDTTLGVGTLAALRDQPPAANQPGCKTPDGRIGSLTIVPSDSEDAEIGIQAIMGVNGLTAADCNPMDPAPDCIVARRALRFVPHTPLTLPIAMSASCLGKLCAEGQTCLDGICVPAHIPDPQGCTQPGGCGPPVDAGSDAQVPPEGLVLHYTFDQPPNGLTVEDESGNGNDGTLQGASVQQGVGHSGGGLVVTTSGVLIMPPMPVVNDDAGATVAMWVRVDLLGAPNTALFFDHDPFEADDLALWLDPSTLLVCGDGNLHHTAGSVCSETALSLGVWAHIALVVDATSVTIYIDGQSRGTGAATPSFVLNADAYLGFEWEGVIDDARIYRRPLSAAEVDGIARL